MHDAVPPHPRKRAKGRAGCPPPEPAAVPPWTVTVRSVAPGTAGMARGSAWQALVWEGGKQSWTYGVGDAERVVALAWACRWLCDRLGRKAVDPTLVALPPGTDLEELRQAMRKTW